jgi:hypothetical protein
MDTVSITAAYTNYSKIWDKDPYDNSNWNMAKLNNINRAWVFQNNVVASGPDSFGITEGAYRYNATAYYAEAIRFQADFSGDIDTLLLLHGDHVNTSNKTKMAIYSDSGSGSGYPYQLLDSTAQVNNTNGWTKKNLVTGNVSVTCGTYYWLCFRHSGSDTVVYRTSEPNYFHRYMDEIAWNDPWPATFPIDANGNNNRQVMQALGQDETNRITQSFITVYYQTSAAVAKKKPGGIIQDESRRGTIEGGIAR